MSHGKRPDTPLKSQPRGGNMRSNVLALIILATVLGSTQQAFAVDVTSNTTWSALNPLATDTVNIKGNFRLMVDVGNAQCSALNIGVSTFGNGATLGFVSGSKLTVSNTITVGVTSGTPAN